MADIQNLIRRIDSEFGTFEAKLAKLRTEQLQSEKGREKRLLTFEKTTEGIRDIWESRLETLAKKFGDRMQVTPVIEPSRRAATFTFKSDLAHIELRFSASTNADATTVVFSYDLRIIPILMQFDSHSELEFPIDAVDREKATQWLDDCIVTFVRTYLSLHENEYYLKGHMVTDPVNNVRFPDFAAAATLERDGKTYYFVSTETKQQFEQTQGKTSTKPQPAARRN